MIPRQWLVSCQEHPDIWPGPSTRSRHHPCVAPHRCGTRHHSLRLHRYGRSRGHRHSGNPLVPQAAEEVRVLLILLAPEEELALRQSSRSMQGDSYWAIAYASCLCSWAVSATKSSSRYAARRHNMLTVIRKSPRHSPNKDT